MATQIKVTVFVLLTVSVRGIELHQTEDSHFRQIGRISGTTGMAHLILKVDFEDNFKFLDELCDLPQQLIQRHRIFKEKASKRMVSTITTHCEILKDTVREQRMLWNNPHNWNSGSLAATTIRNKRQAVGMAIMGLIAAGGALFQWHELHSIANRQDKLTLVIKDHETRLKLDERSIDEIDRTVNALSLQVKGEGDRVIRDETMFVVKATLDTAYAESQRIIRGVNTLANNRLSPDLIKTQELIKAVETIRINLRSEGYELGISQYQEVFACETSHLIFDNGTLIIMVHLPAQQKNSQMKLYEYSGIPWSLPQLDMSVSLSTRHQLLAVNEDESLFKVIDATMLDRCPKIGDVYFCPNANVYDRRVKEECLMNLFTSNMEGISKNCPWKAAPSKDAVLQLNAHSFLLYHATKTGVRLICPSQPEELDTFQGVRILTVPKACRAYTDSFVMDGQSELTFRAESFSARPLNWTSVLGQLDFTPSSFSVALTRLRSAGHSKDLTVDEIRRKEDESTSWTRFSWTVGISTVGILVTITIWISLRCCVGRVEFPLLWPLLQEQWDRCRGRAGRWKDDEGIEE